MHWVCSCLAIIVETTAGTTIAFMLAMTCFPEVQQKAHEELDRVLGDRSPTFDDEDNVSLAH